MQRARAFLSVLVTLSIANAVDARDFGKIAPLGTVLATSCVSVKSFDSKLRASPGLEGKDRFVAYIDFSDGMGSGNVFVISPVNVTTEMPIADVLIQADHRRSKFWKDARLTMGDYEIGKPFEAYVPEDSTHPSPGVTLTKRPSIQVRGHLQEACGKLYLVVVYATPFGTEERSWTMVRQGYETLLANLQWPQ